VTGRGDAPSGVRDSASQGPGTADNSRPTASSSAADIVRRVARPSPGPGSDSPTIQRRTMDADGDRWIRLSDASVNLSGRRRLDGLSLREDRPVSTGPSLPDPRRSLMFIASKRSACRNCGSRSPAACAPRPAPNTSPRSAATSPPPPGKASTPSTHSCRPPPATPGLPPPPDPQPPPALHTVNGARTPNSGTYPVTSEAARILRCMHRCPCQAYYG
jgi:hypothetical protein